MLPLCRPARLLHAFPVASFAPSRAFRPSKGLEPVFLEPLSHAQTARRIWQHCDRGLFQRAPAAAASMAPRDDPADITAEAALLEAFSEIPTVAGAWVHPAGPGTSTLTVRC